MVNKRNWPIIYFWKETLKLFFSPLPYNTVFLVLCTLKRWHIMPPANGGDLNFTSGSHSIQKSRIQIDNKQLIKTTTNMWILYPGSFPTQSFIQHHFKWNFTFPMWATYCVKRVPQTISFHSILEVTAFILSPSGQWTILTRQGSPEKNGSRWWWVSADLCDPDQAGTKAAELDTTVVMLR